MQNAAPFRVAALVRSETGGERPGPTSFRDHRS